MSIDEALKQLSFYKRKGAEIVKEVISVFNAYVYASGLHINH